MDGYAKLASLMGAYPEVAIIRRFAALNTQNILYLQAELVNLESRLRLVEEDDRKSGDVARVDAALDWFKLSKEGIVVSVSGSQDGSSRSSMRDDAQPEGEEDDREKGASTSRRWKLVLQIREKLKEYNEAVLQQTALTNLQKPNPRDLRFLTEWMERPDMGNVLLEGQDSDVWEKPDRLDLIVLKPRRNESLLSVWLSDRFIHWYHQTISYKMKSLFTSRSNEEAQTENFWLDTIARRSNTTYHSQAVLLRVTRLFSMTLASLLPIAAIVILYCVQNTVKRLAIIAAATTIFSFTLGLATNGELVDVFAASSAFAAVQVVFVGSALSNTTITVSPSVKIG